MIKIICLFLLLAQFSNAYKGSEDNFVNLLQETDVLIDESYNLLDKISSQSKEINDYQDQELQHLEDESVYESSEEDLKSSKVIECIKKYKSDVEEFISRTKESLEKCAGDISKDVIILLEDVISIRHLIIQEREKLKFLVEECVSENSNNPIGTIICVGSKGEYIKIQLRQLIEKLKTVLNDAQFRIDESLTQTKTCIKSQTTEAISVIKKYISDVKGCIKKP